MSSVVGIVFSNIHDKSIPELTKLRTMASVPFGCRYRLIDFTLSNMVNGGINHVGVITHYNYQSLMDHIGSGKDWDLARRAGGIQILPPYITAFANAQNSLYTTRLEALKNILSYISGCKEEYVVLSDCDVICNIDLGAMIERHIESEADATIITKRVYLAKGSNRKAMIVNSENGVITSMTDFTGLNSDFYDICANIWIMRRKFLETEIIEAVAQNYTSFSHDIIKRNLSKYMFRVEPIDVYFASVDSMTGYYLCNMELLNPSVRKELFGVEGRPVLTKVRNSPPTIYKDGATVKNSLIADGCIIEGTVENSVIFRGVRIGKGTRVKNSILMQDTLTGENVFLNAVITDKNVVVRDGRVLSGHETLPFYIEKNKQV